ncbi:Cobyric acid synthase [Candidatus Terasakiella magnetica]|uniref:Cobyric acid synthase n=1 Tax=Candidatus Terasakiella magnetica TaxID=1867952 RepID=A0A1C3RGK3_9PROT|nr:cobyric acid synthase [Candidatus Terasakiella magnetica]SCA56395.1 Cobyric acid synthase [Candidatus Terasakiella magnetica]
MPKSPKALMFQGTGSDVGKSLLVAGLCRAFVRRGLKVAPFKPQNMSNNAAVTREGGEIGRAQALQARACGLDLSIHMNPVLLKPQSDVGSQVVVQGEVVGNATARDYTKLKLSLMPKVLESFHKLAETADLVLVEGAGSAAEVNLRKSDIANMGFAEAADIPVILIGDIDRGGVIASIVGTHCLISESEKLRTKGYLINKFRGDPSLFTSALDIIKDQCDQDCFGIVPYFKEASLLPDEDAMSLDNRKKQAGEKSIKIIVPRFSRIANFDDLDPLRAENDVDVVIVEAGSALPADGDVILLPGSKATLADLAYMYEQGWDIDIKAHVRRGGRVVGLCGGYQMLGQEVCDPDGIEGKIKSMDGLGLLPMKTVMKGPKTLRETSGTCLETSHKVSGYEMHMGVSKDLEPTEPWLELEGKKEGRLSKDGLIMGTYLHGIFNSDEFRHAFLKDIRAERSAGVAYDQQIEDVLDQLAEHLEEYCDLDGLLALAG